MRLCYNISMKLLNGAELRDFIKERQAKQVRGLRQAYGVFPKLAIIETNPLPVIDTYVRLKQRYGEDILVDVEVHQPTEPEVLTLIDQLNHDESVHGIIVQLPLHDASRTDEVLNAVAPEKDVDALGEHATLDPATPTAINWLLAGYNVDLRGKDILIIGAGRLVGAPLARMWRQSGLQVTVATRDDDIPELVQNADIVVSATGTPELVTADMPKINAVLVDAGTASEGGVIKGDLAKDVYEERHDLTITPQKGGVGPLTVAALFDNVIQAALRRKDDVS